MKPFAPGFLDAGSGRVFGDAHSISVMTRNKTTWAVGGAAVAVGLWVVVDAWLSSLPRGELAVGRQLTSPWVEIFTGSLAVFFGVMLLAFPGVGKLSWALAVFTVPAVVVVSWAFALLLGIFMPEQYIFSISFLLSTLVLGIAHTRVVCWLAKRMGAVANPWRIWAGGCFASLTFVLWLGLSQVLNGLMGGSASAAALFGSLMFVSLFSHSTFHWLMKKARAFDGLPPWEDRMNFPGEGPSSGDAKWRTVR